jgi:hypothetical protein
MSSLPPSLSSDEEDNIAVTNEKIKGKRSKKKKKNKKKKQHEEKKEQESDDSGDEGEMNENFEFGGLLVRPY